MPYRCTDFSEIEDWSFGELKFHILYTGVVNNPYAFTMGFTGGNWISPFNSSWNLSTSLSYFPRSDTGVLNSTPRVATSPVVRLQEGCYNTFHIPVSDPDDDIIRCRWGVGIECAGICNHDAFPGAELDSENCSISYNTIYGSGIRAAAIMIEDFVTWSEAPLSSVAYQVVVMVYSSDVPCFLIPLFISPTITNNETCVAIPFNGTLSMELLADSRFSNLSIIEIQTVSPAVVSKSDLLRNGQSNIYSVNVTLASEIGEDLDVQFFCYTAINSDGISSNQVCLDLLLGTTPPIPLADTASPNMQQVHPPNTTWTIRFNSTIERPLTVAYITFHDFDTGEQVYRIDTASSSEVSFVSDNLITINPSYTFDEKKEFYINFERGVAVSLEGCKPGNEPVSGSEFWVFETLDTTPPSIHYYNPYMGNPNITIYWGSYENITCECSLNTTTQQTVVECRNYFLGYWYWQGVNVPGGSYQLDVACSDLAGNEAEPIQFFFDIDAVPPTASITTRPNEYSNERIAHFNFTCDEYCIFHCEFIIHNNSDTETVLETYWYSTSLYPTPSLSHGITYTFCIIPYDHVYNIGQTVCYTWETDFENPTVFGVIDTNALCTGDLSPANTGEAQAVDNDTAIASLTFSDSSTGCSLERTWRAVDLAGNVGEVTQIITLEYTPTLNYLSSLSVACDSASGPTETPTTTATVSNPCGRQLQLTYEDSVISYSCPGIFNRTWIVTDYCDQTSTPFTQTIALYDVCPLDACGRNETPPHGVCILGTCSCNVPWYEDDCNTLIHSPLLQPVNDTVLMEYEDYAVSLTLIEGAPPFIWTLVSAPRFMILNRLTGEITWSDAQAGNHTVIVDVTNRVQTDSIRWTISVKVGYTAVLDPILNNVFSMASPIEFTGHVDYFEENAVQESLFGIVPVTIVVTVHNARREIAVLTRQDGTFVGTFYPAATEYGTYVAGAKHPSSSTAMEQITWDFLGMRATPQAVQLTGSTVEEFRATFHNATVITNNGPHALHGLIPTVSLGSIEGLNIAINLSLSSVLEPGESSYMSIEVESTGALHVLFPVTLESEEGVRLYITVNLKIAQTLPRLAANPGSVNTRIVRGIYKVLEFNITNEGSVPASMVRALLPMTDFLTLISFGISQDQTEAGFTLGSQESAILSVLATVPLDQPLGIISGQIVISSMETFLTLQFNFQVSSNVLMNLTVLVEDEYTYFADGQPLVEGAVVRLTNKNGDTMETLTTGEDGTITFVNILEDRYEISTSGPNHIPVNQIIITSAEQAIYTVFLARRAVTYSFTVVPIVFEETYTITLAADFETHVPIPVVTITPSTLSLGPYELGIEDTIQYNITNHGLIRADDVRFSLPDSHPFLEFATDIEDIGSLDPLTSVIIPVTVTRIDGREKRNIVACAAALFYAIDVLFSYVCGELQTRSASALLQGTSQYDCGGGGGGGGGTNRGKGARLVEIIPPEPEEIIDPTPRNIVRPDIKDQRFITLTVVNCRKCITDFLKCFLSLPDFPLTDCFYAFLSGEITTFDINDSLSWLECSLGRPGSLREEIKNYIESIPALKLGVRHALKLACYACAVYDCFYINGELQYVDVNERSVESTVRDMAEAWYPAYATILLSEEVLGDSAWIETVQDAEWVSLALRPILSDESDMGTLVSQQELLHLQSFPPPEGATMEMTQKMVERLNNTFYSWNNGILEPTSGENMASYSAVENYTNDIDVFNERLKEYGHPSFFEAYNTAAEQFNTVGDFNEAGLCAVVRIQIEQELALTREGFLAKMEIENKELSDLTQIQLDIIVTDANSAVNSIHLFSISNESLSGSLTSSTGGWTLPSSGSGAAEWLIVPYTEAAPTEDQAYNIGGTLSYSVNNDSVSIPLLPTRIVVMPDPSLAVHYFWEKYVIGDNPFTDEKEPSVPFALGVAIHNAGYGVATNLHITSGQPEIIENEKGLQITFKIVGVYIGRESVSPSLTVDFGDIPANTTRVARWWMISSLQGEFMNYSASFEYTNPLGDPKLSVLDELEIHELIRNVLIYQEDENDGILDFLVNDVSDLSGYPDALYNSKIFTRYNVSIGDIALITNIDNEDLITVHAISNYSGWVYFRYEDLHSLFSSAERSINVTKSLNNETIDLPPENAWITEERQTSASEQEQPLYLHIFDYLEEAGEVNYILKPCTSDCPIDEQPFDTVLPPGKVLNVYNS